MKAASDTSVEWDPYDPELVRNPWSVFARLREEMPLYHNVEHGFFALSRFDDCQRGLSDTDTFHSGQGVILEVIKAGHRMPPGFFIAEDAPSHPAYRSVLAKTFTAPRMAQLERKIREFYARTLDPLVGARPFRRGQGIRFAGPDKSHRNAARHSRGGPGRRPPPADERLRAEDGKPMSVLKPQQDPGFRDYIDFRVKHPSDDLMSELLHTEFVDGEGERRRLTIDEVHIMVQLLAAAGNETTNKLIGWTVKLLAEHPDQRRTIVNDRELLHPTIEEVLRFEPVGDHVARYVSRNFEAYGQTVPAGSIMMFLTGAANRDERQFADAERFDIRRDRRLHLTFGYGPHLCIGAALARIEGRIALDELLNRFAEWDVEMAGARMASTSTVRGWEALPMIGR